MRISDWSSDVCSSALDVRQQSGRMPSRLAIVDSAPREQFLYPEFELYAGAFREHGVDCGIGAPEELKFGPDGLADRSEKRRVGKECVSTCRHGWSTEH